MSLQIISIISIIALMTFGCSSPETVTILSSPDGNTTIEFRLDTNGTPTYRVNRKDKLVIAPSSLGMEFKNQAAWKDGLQLNAVEIKNESETWEMPWGEQRSVDNTYNAMEVTLSDPKNKGRQLILHFRAYDDGVALRYELPTEEGLSEVTIMDEHTQFQLTGDHDVWWIPGDWDIYEHLYSQTKVSGIDALSYRDNEILAATYIPENAVNTPVTMRTQDGLHLSIHEANLTNYPGMTLKVDNQTYKLTSELVGSDRSDHKAVVSLPFKTPWRTIQLSETAGGLIESNLIVNLNEPSKIDDMSWFTPMKYAGIWWEMHLGLSTWDMEATQDMNTWVGEERKQVTHGATTENTKRYIDFAAENGLGGVLVEGWNTGWNRWIGFEDREGVFDFVTPYEDYDLAEVSRYAQEKGVEIIMHHETSSAPRTYEQQLDSAFALMQQYGMHSVKTGYVGRIIPKGEYHHGQWMVNHYREVLETAAKYQVAINAHEPIKATGIRRTYPNAISREGLRGQEFNAWSNDGGNPPNHLPTVAFTRMLGGPIDFTPGVFDISLPTKPKNQINTTVAQQLALYVVIYSPVQMACDLPQHYEGRPGMQFIRDVGVDWEQSKVLNGEVGEFLTIARQERNSGNWFVGGITNEESRQLQIDLDFLKGGTYEAKIYKDAADAHYRDNPEALDIEVRQIQAGDSITIDLAPGGGFAISLLPSEQQ